MLVTRRETLRLGVAAFLSSLAGGAASQNLAGKKIIVVGAGIAGLAAAQQLQSQGAEVIVLEAEDYIGGRIRTDRSMGAPFEYGAGWIHGPSARNPIKVLADQVDAQTAETDDDNLEVFDAQGQPLSDDAYDHLDDLYHRLDSKFDAHQEHDETRSLRDLINELEPGYLDDPIGRWMASAYFEFDLGAGIDDISAMNAFEDDAFAGDDVVFTQGYDVILAPLLVGLDVRLNTRVARIFYDKNGVDVDGLKADYVVCAVPLGVLKAGAIAFDPPLPSNVQNAVDEIGFGTVTKIAFKFEHPFWDVETQYFGIMTEPKGRWNYWLNYRTFSDENILLGLSFGDYAPIADKMNERDMTADAMQVLRTVWEDDVSTPLQTLTTHWSENPSFNGAYSYPQVGGSAAQFERFEAPIAGRLFMAGEHTLFKYHSTTGGALLSGRRAATAIAAMKH
ncbi:MAG: NAD(P)/FAD-dependent oxidoreductase [Sulfitobacter sp.]